MGCFLFQIFGETNCQREDISERNCLKIFSEYLLMSHFALMKVAEKVDATKDGQQMNWQEGGSI